MQEKTTITTVTFQDIWDDKIDSTYKKKLEVDGNAYKYRLYYKTVWNDAKKSSNLLTFIMLNPSTANQYSNDPSVNNCIKIAKKCNEYDGIEVLNVYSLRHPDFAKIKDLIKNGEGNPSDINYDIAKCKNVVLAWGNKKIKLNEKLFAKIKSSSTIYILGVNDATKIDKDYKFNKNQIRHPDNRAWTRLGGIENAKLFEIDKNKFINNGYIQE